MKLWGGFELFSSNLQFRSSRKGKGQLGKIENLSALRAENFAKLLLQCFRLKISVMK